MTEQVPSENLPSDNQPGEDWCADQLRRVPLPDGLLKRLRTAAVASDEQLDAALREVPLPAGLADRLAEAVPVADAAVDRAVADVPLGPGLLDRLRTIPEYTHPHVESWMRDVPVPDHLLDRLSRIPFAVARPSAAAPAARRPSWREGLQIALAACLLLAISVSYLVAVGSFVATAYRRSTEDALAIALREPSLSLEGELVQPVEALITHAAADEMITLVPPPKEPPPDPPLDFTPGAVTRDFLGDLPRWLGEAWAQRLSDAPLPERGPLLATPLPDKAVTLRRVEDISVAAGSITPPLLDPELILFQIIKGAHPFQDPSADPSLATCTVPLGATTASYDAAVRLVRDFVQSGSADRRRLKATLARQVRTEEFLAAIDYPVAAADQGTLAVRAFGGPSPWGEPGCRMLQVVTTAGQPVGAAADGQTRLASAVRLTVRFDPQTVAEYRLLGHEATSTVGLLDVPVEVNLRPGQTSVGLFELRLKSSSRDPVGWATLTWYDREAEFHQLRQPIGRLQFASTFAESALPLQVAVLVAETAELLRGSPFAQRPHSSLKAVRQMAEQVDPAWQEEPSFAAFVSFLETALQAGLR